MPTSGQIRAARALLGLSQQELAKAAGVSARTLESAEGAGQSAGSLEGVDAIIAALETAGVEFLPEDGGGAGVRLKKASPAPLDTEELNASNDE